MPLARPSRPIDARTAVVLLATLAGVAFRPAPAVAASTAIASKGPLEAIYVDENLACQVQVTGDLKPSFYGGTAPGACGTFLALTEAEGLEEPGAHRLFGSEPLAGGIAPTAFRLQGQELTGAGTKANPFVLTTHVNAVEPRIEGEEVVAAITEVDSYVVGQSSYETAITVKNEGPGVPMKGTLYHAGDCLLSGLDTGYGAAGVAGAGSVACTIEPNDTPSARFMAFAPLTTAGANFGPVSATEAAFRTMWSSVNGEATPFPNTVDALENLDNAMGVSWPIKLTTARKPAEQSATVRLTTTIAPTSPPSSSAAAGSCVPSGQVPVTVAAVNGPKAVDYVLDGAPVASIPTDAAGNATIALGQGQHTLEYWGEDETKAQEGAHHVLGVTVGSAPAVTIASDQGKTGYEVGETGSVSIVASGAGLTSDPSAKGVPISTAKLGTFSVSRSATNACGTTEATFDYAVLGPPVLGKSVNVDPVSGKVFVALPPGAKASLAGPPLEDATKALAKGLKFVPLAAARQIPVGSVLETTAGVARLTTATSKKGKLQLGSFGAGIFKLLQSRRQKGLTELDVVDNHSARSYCASTGKARVARHLSSRTLGRLTGSAHGKFTTRGKYSAATVRGTIWGVTDRCDGTLTKVTRGVVKVRDFVRRRTVTVLAGHQYLARARG